ncbi:hypothetical protein RLA27_00790 [Streptococcus pneumoniae]|nr:hypothetical protein [Streptococcus pneumoniae]MDS4990293.1 hypothetical protein [Streptococcus pneumoniae]
MTLDLDNMTQAEFDKQMAEIKVTPEEVDEFLKMERAEQVEYIKNYQARV